ncbi:MAG: AAA family ATPase, partial [Nannocystaceae bacterium]
MKFERLVLERYGQFERLDLDLAGDLVIVYGPNEAGKTTLLSAVHALMFGIENRTPYNFMYDYQAMSIRAEMRDGAGRQLQLRRRKRRKQDLTGVFEGPGGSGVLDPKAWAAYFGGLNETLYRSVFGFTQHHLQQGSEVLRLSGLHEILGGGALGGAGQQVHTVLDALRSEAEALYKGRGRNPPINRLTSELTRLRAELRGATFDREQYQQLTRELHRISDQLASDGEKIEALRTRHGHLLRALDHFEDLGELQVLLQHKHADATPALEEPSARQVLEAAEALARLSARRAELDQQLAQLRARAQALQTDPKLLAHQVTINRLATLAVTLTDLHHALPAQRAASSEARKQLRASLYLHVAVSKRVDAVTWLLKHAQSCEQLTELAHRVQGQEQAHAQQVAERLEVSRTISERNLQLEQQRAGLPSKERQALADVLEEMGRQRVEVARLRHDADQARRTCETLKSCIHSYLLDPESGSIPPADACPDDGEILAARTAWEQQYREQHALTNRLAQARESLEVARAQYNALAEAEEIPDPRQLAEVRVRRDRTWAAIRRVWERGEAPDLETQAYAQGGDLGAAMTRAIEDADLTVDRMRDAAERVAQRVDLLGQIARHETELKLRRARIDKLEAEYAALRSAWEARWQPLGLRPGAPAQMLQVRAQLGDYHASTHKLAALEARIAEVAEPLAAYEQQLRGELEAPPGTAWPVLVQTLRAQVEAGHHGAGQIASMQVQLSTLDARATQLTASCKAVAEELSELQAQLQDGLQALGLRSKSGGELAAVTALVDTAKKLYAQDEALAEQTSRLESFATEVAELCASLGDEDPQGHPVQVAERLAQALRVAESADAAKRHADLEIADREQARTQVATNFAERVGQIEAWQSRVAVSDLDALVEAARASLEIAEVQKSRAQLERRLARALGAGPKRTEVEQLVLATAQSEIESESIEVGRKLAALEAQRFQLVERRGKLQAEFETLGGDRAAGLSSTYQQHLADLEVDVEKFAIASLAHRILDDVTRAFVREHQPTLLSHTSRLMGLITGGRHPRVEAERGADTLSLIDEIGNPRKPAELSTGTREQLFLALRMAYVLEFCDRAEPLP